MQNVNVRVKHEKYLQRLSPFAQSVLRILIKQQESEVFPTPNTFGQSSKEAHDTSTSRILSFHDSHDLIAAPICSDQNDYLKEIPFNFNFKPNDVLTSVELVKSFNAEKNVTYNNQLIHNNLNNDIIDERNDGIGKENSECNFNQPEDVKWNDMFADDILNDYTNHNTEKQSTNIMYTDSKIDEGFINDENNDINNCKAKDKVLKTINKKEIKPKIQTLDIKSNKIKKGINHDNIKISYRKEKYTKTIKNWLNDVLSNNLVEEFIENRIENTVGSKDTEMTNKPCKNKKFIQTQLTNKEGMMKFCKPKIINVEVHQKPDKLLKEKNVKSKFVAPIKSQLPIMDITYEITIINANNYKDVLRKYENEHTEIIAIMCHSNGFCQLNSHCAYDICDPEGVMFFVNNNYLYYAKKDNQTDIHYFINILLNNTLICYDGKKLLIYLKTQLNYNFEYGKIKFYDIKIGGYLLDPDSSLENFTDLQKLISFIPNYTIATESGLQKCAWYITILKECANKLKKLLIDNSLWSVFETIEMRLIPIIADMEIEGIAIDTEKLKSMETTLEVKMKMVEQECYRAAGKSFQINSTVQVRAILYEELQLDNKCNVKIRETITKGAKSTSETMLRSLMSVHPLPKLILEYRHLHKALATFVTGIAQHVKDSTVRPTWLQTAAATGRIASNNPNLQAIPKTNFNLAMYPERSQEDQQLNFRSVYIARDGYTLLAADFKHIECRVFAYIAADSELLDALKSPDIFQVLAAKWLNKPEDAVSKEDRERTKRIVYANLYGAGTRKLMDILNVSYDQALSIVSSFNRTFPSLKTFARNIISQCEQNGGRLSTLTGRMRHFKHISSNDFTLKSHAERQAINFIVQGTAADLCKTAMVLTERQLKNTSRRIRGHLVLQIHDELVWEVAEHDAHRAAAILKEVMEHCGHECGMNIVLPVEMSCGRDWAGMIPI